MLRERGYYWVAWRQITGSSDANSQWWWEIAHWDGRLFRLPYSDRGVDPDRLRVNEERLTPPSENVAKAV